MTLEFEFVQDYQTYRKYLTYISTVDDAMGMLPFLYYQGNMLAVYVIELKDGKVEVTMTNNTKELQERFLKDAQPDSFEGIPENTAYLYDIAKHELIYNFDGKETSSKWSWSTYPDTFWIQDDDLAYDHGLMIGADGTVCRSYLSNKRLHALFVGLSDLNMSFPPLLTNKSEVTIVPDGVHLVLATFADQLGQPEPKIGDVKKAMACDMLNPEAESIKYDCKDLIELFQMKGNEDDLWEDTWGAGVQDALARDDERDRRMMDTSTLGQITQTFNDHLNVSELADLGEVPQVDRLTYVHLDVPIHGIHYMQIEPDQTLVIFYDGLLIRPDDIYQHLDNLPQSQLSLHGDYDRMENVSNDELEALYKSGTIASLQDEMDETFGSLDTNDDDAKELGNDTPRM
jgi:hypothetical protein